MEPPSPATGPIVEHPDRTRADPDTEKFTIKGARRPHVFVRQEIKAPDSRFLVASFVLKNRGKSPASVRAGAIAFRADWIGDVGFGAVGFDGLLILKRTDTERELAAGAKTELQAGETRTLRYLIAAPPDGKLTWSADGRNWKSLTNAAVGEEGNS